MQNTLENQSFQGDRIWSEELKVDKKLKLSIKNCYEKLGIKLSKAELEKDDGSKGLEHILNNSIKIISPVTEKEQKLEELRKPQTYPNDYVFASLAERSYEEKKRVLNENQNVHGEKVLGDWILLTGAFHNLSGYISGNIKSFIDNVAYNVLGGLVGDPNGYFGVAYWNPKMQQVIIVHRGTENIFAGGTDSIDSIFNADLHGFILNQHVGQIDSAITFTDKIITVLDKINKETGLKIQLFITGHSLGAWLAPITAFSAKYLKREGDNFVKIDSDFETGFEKEGYHTSTMIFDGPGARCMLERIQDRLMSRSGTCRINSLDIINYLSAPNMINACNPQVGDKYRVFIHISEEEKTFWNMTFYYNLFVHSIKKIKDVFDPETGDVLEYEEGGNLRIKKIEDWPSLLPENPSTKVLEKLTKTFAAQLIFACIPGKDLLYTIGKIIAASALSNAIVKSTKWHLEMKPELRHFFEFASKANDFHFDNNTKDTHKKVRDNYFRTVRYKLQDVDKNTYKNMRNLNVFTRSERQFLERYKYLQKYPASKLTKLFDDLGDEELMGKFNKLLEECKVEDGTVYCSNLSEFIPDIKRMLHFFPEIKTKLDKAYQESPATDIFEAASSSYLNPIKKSFDLGNDTFGLKAFLEDSSRKFLHAVHSCTSLGVVKVYKTLNAIGTGTDYCQCFLNLDRIFYLKDSVLIKFLKNIQRKCLLVVECDEELNSEIERFLERLFKVLLGNQNTKVILVTEKDSKLSSFVNSICNILGMSYQEKTLEVKFNDLTLESQKTFLEEKIVIFQGKEVSLSTVLNYHTGGDLDAIIDPKTFAHLFNNEKIDIGKPLPSLGEVGDYYINRKLMKKEKLKEEVLRDENLTDLFAVTGVHKRELSVLANGAKVRSFDEEDDQSNPTRFIKLDEVAKESFDEEDNSSNPTRFIKLDEAEERFETLCRQYGDSTIHWLKVDNGSIIWKKSHGKTLSGFRKYIENYEVDYDVYNVNVFNEKFIVIAAEPGMGKTTVLTYLGIENADDSKWFIRINLVDYRDRLEQRNFSETTSVVKFLRENNIVSNELAEKLLEFRLAKSGNIVFLLDGFDEISSEGQKNTVNFLKILQGTKVDKVFISTRLHLRNELEDSLSTIAYSLKPFDSKDQEQFLKKFWEKDIDPEIEPGRLDRYIRKLIGFIPKYIGDKERKFMGIPMQMRMVAEAFEKELEKFLLMEEFIFPEKFDMLKLYDKFIDAKYQTYFKKKGTSVKCFSKAEMLLITKGLNEVLMYLAMEEHYPNVEKDLFSEKLPSEESKQVMNLVGIAQFINNRTVFTHRTFGEYFAAHFLVNTLSENELKHKAVINFLSKELFENKTEVIKSFIDYSVAKNDLHAAILKGKLDVVKRILSTVGTNINVTDILERSALHYAAQEEYKDIVNLLFNCGAKVEADKLGKTALHYAARFNHGTQVVQCILEKAEHYINNEDKNGCTAIYYAAQQGNWEVVHFLIQKGALTNSLDIEKLLFHYTYIGSLEGVQKMTEQQNIDITAVKDKSGNTLQEIDITAVKDKSGNTLLHIATQRGHLKIADFLLDKGADISITNNSGKRPISYAAEKKHWDIVESLLMRKEAEFKHLYDEQKESLLKYSARKVNWDIVKLFLADNGRDSYFHCLEIQQRVQFLCLSICAKDFGVAEFLINKGTDLDKFDSNNKRPIHYAAEKGYWNIVVLLLEKGAKLYLNPSQKISLLRYSAEKFNWKIVELLMKNHGMRDNFIDDHLIDVEQKIHCLHYMISVGNLDITKYFIDKLNFSTGVNSPGQNGQTLLHFAAQDGQLNIVQFFVEEKGANVKAISDCESTPLHLAAKKGHLETVKYLVKKGADIYLCDKSSKAAIDIARNEGHGAVENFLSKIHTFYMELSCAVREGSLEDVRCLIENSDIDINFKYRHGFTVLLIAARECKYDIVKYLVEKGADVGIEDNSGNNVLHWSTFIGKRLGLTLLLSHDNICSVRRSNLKVQTKPVEQVTIFIDKNKKEMFFEKSRTGSVDCLHYGEILYSSCIEDSNNDIQDSTEQLHQLDLIKFLVGAKNVDPNIRNALGNTVVHLLAICGSVDALKYLFDEKSAEVDLRNKSNSTPLHFATCKNVAECLVERGSDINAENNYGNVPLHYAVIYGYLDVVKFLIEKGALIDIKNIDGNSPLHCAVEKEKIDIVKHLIEMGADLTVKNVDGKTPKDLSTGDDYRKVLEQAEPEMLIKAAKQGNLNRVRSLINHGVDIDSRDENSWTSLHFAAAEGHLELVKYLLENGADVLAQNNHDSVLHCAVKGNADVRMLEFVTKHLLEDELSQNDEDSSQLGNKEEIIRLVLNKIRETRGNIDEHINVQDTEGDTPLMWAAQSGWAHEAEILLEYNPNSEVRNNDGITALHWTAVNGHPDVAKLLIDYGANIHAVDNYDRKPIHIAALHGHTNVIEFILNNKEVDVDVDDTDKSGWAPLCYAACKGKTKTCEFLISRGANISAGNENGRSFILVAAAAEKVQEQDRHDILGPNSLAHIQIDPDDLVTRLEEVYSEAEVDAEYTATKFKIDAEELYNKGEFKQAMRLFKLVLAVQKKPDALGPFHPDTLKTQVNVAVLLSKLGEYEKALEILAEVLQIQRESGDLDGDNADTCTTFHHIAEVYYKQGKYKDALKMYEDVLQKRELILETNHRDILLTRHHIARVLNNQGNHELALQRFREVFKLQYQMLGTDHPDTLKTKLNIAYTLIKLGKYTLASSMIIEMLDEGEKVLGLSHPDYLTIHHVSALLLLNRHNYEVALKILKTVYEEQEKQLGPDHSDTLATRHDIAVALFEQGKKEEGMKIFQEVYEKRKKVLGPDHLYTSYTNNYIKSIERQQQSSCRIQ